jgi:GTPase SAR1 family protein
VNEAETIQRIDECADQRSTALNLAFENISQLPAAIGRLSHLEELSLNGNQLSSLPREIGQLTKLRKLSLVENRLTFLPAEITKLKRLTELDLGGNRFDQLPAEIRAFDRLTSLSCWGVPLQRFPRDILDLRDLTLLDVSSCSLQTLPPGISGLRNLEVLRLNDNELTHLPPELGLLPKLSRLDLWANPLREPSGVIVDQGTNAVLWFLRELLRERGTKRWISKLLIVGEGGSGKTQLLRALRGKRFQPESDTTHGLNIDTLQLAHPHEPVQMTMHVWDFGGQEIYHATHQFFLTDHSLFLLVWNARLGYEQGRLYYWLDTIKALAPESPVMLVATHVDERDAALPLDNLRRKYPAVVGSWNVSSRKRKLGDGIELLMEDIAKTAAGLRLMGEIWPSSWLDASNAIRGQRGDKYIQASKLWEIMERKELLGDSKRTLARWMHELGEILYFEDDDELKDTVLLDPHWVTRNISQVLVCEDIIDGHGVFRREHMEKVWSRIARGMWDRLLRLMERFDLSYRIPDDPENRSLVVERLNLDPPDYEAEWDAMLRRRGCKEIAMKFDLGSTRPAGIPTWFIARSHRFTKHTHWRYGALLTDAPHQRHLALVYSPPSVSEAYVSLQVRGPCPHNFFVLLKDGLELTLARFQGLRDVIRRTMPCPGRGPGICSHEFDYAQLQRRIELEQPRHEIECPECLNQLSVVEMLFGIHWPTTEQLVIQHLNELEQREEWRHETLMKGQEEIRDLVGDLRELAQRQFLLWFNSQQRLEESHCPRVVTVRPKGKRKWLPNYTGCPWELRLYCEAPGCWHPVEEGGQYEIREPARWLEAIAPHLRRLVKVLKYVTPVVGPWLRLSAEEVHKLVEPELDLMEKLVELLPEIRVREKGVGKSWHEDSPSGANPMRFEGATLRGLRTLLEELDPKERWGDLRKVLTPEGHWLWLCKHHAAEYSNP